MAKKTVDDNEPDFSEFSDWLVNIHHLFDHLDSDEGSGLSNQEISLIQEIVQRNIDLALDENAWKQKVSAFEAELNKIKDEKKRKETREKFAIHFNEYKFSADELADFSRRYYPCSTYFTGVNFGDRGVDFSLANFDEDSHVSFANAKFGKGRTVFFRAKFGNRGVNFENINSVSESMSFAETKFGKWYVWFTDAQLKCELINFSRAKFAGEFIFTPNKEKSQIGSASFNDIEVAGNLTINTEVEKEATFQRLDVKGSADFSGSEFAQVPDFRDMKLDRPPEVAGMKVMPPKMGLFLCTDKHAANKYRKLKSMAIAASDHEKSGEFFAYEMMAKRGVETTGFWALLFNWLYGQSYKRPLALLGITWIIFAFLNIWKILQELVFISGLDFWQNIGLSFVLSFRNLIPFFNSLSRFSPSPKSHESWLQKSMNRLEAESVNIDFLTTLGVIEQLIGAILLFLLLLGLRNAFRMK